jgi:DNA-binding Lrp family transcriptional regulator
MALHTQDVLVVLKIAFGGQDASYAKLAHELDLSPSQTHAAVRRAAKAGLIHAETREVNRRALAEFLIHGFKYIYPAKRGAIARGMPTAHAAAPLRDLFVDDGELLVWPDPKGEVRGESLLPIHKSAPSASRRDPKLYESLALLDAIRAGRARERKVAIKKLEEMLLDEA